MHPTCSGIETERAVAARTSFHPVRLVSFAGQWARQPAGVEIAAGPRRGVARAEIADAPENSVRLRVEPGDDNAVGDQPRLASQVAMKSYGNCR